MPAAWVRSAGCRQQPGCWEQCSHVRASCFTDLSSVGEASPRMALLAVALEQQCVVQTYLPCPAQPAVYSSLCQSGVFHSSAFPGAVTTLLPSISYGVSSSTTATLHFLWCFLKASSNFLSPPTQHCPCNHTSDVYFSARCLSNTSRLTWQKLYSPMAAVGMTAQHVETGFVVYELRERAWLSELPALAWAGLFLRPIYLAFFPNGQWRKQSIRNTAVTGRNLAHFIICTGLSGWVSCGLSHPISNYVPLGAWSQECVSLSESTIYIYLCISEGVKARALLAWGRRTLFQQCSPKAWCLRKAEESIMLL